MIVRVDLLGAILKSKIQVLIEIFPSIPSMGEWGKGVKKAEQ